MWNEPIPYHKRYLSGPKLVAKLSGAARKLIVGKRPDWLSHANGVNHLMQHLRRSLGKPQIPELTEHLTKYFRGSERKKMETMNDYVTRKMETYARAKQALMRVQQYKKHRTPQASSANSHSATPAGTLGTSGRQTTTATPDGMTSQAGATREEPGSEEGLEQSASQASAPDPWASWQWHHRVPRSAT